MRYISPIRFYIHCGLELNDEAFSNPSRLKKLVSAEFAIALEGIISVDGYDYNKNDLLSDLESDAWQKNIEYHKTIWENKLLLQILEFENVKRPKSRPLWFNLSEDKEFVNFISPYFGEALNNLIRKYYHPINFMEARFWLTFLAFVNPEHEEEALSSTRNMLDSIVALFKNLSFSNYEQHMQELKPWINQSWQHYMNELPDSLFYYKDKLAEVIVSFIAQIYRHDLDLAYKLNVRLAAIKGLNPEIADVIKENYNVLSGAKDRQVDVAYASEDYDSGGGGSSGFATFWRILFAIFIIIKLLYTCSR